MFLCSSNQSSGNFRRIKVNKTQHPDIQEAKLSSTMNAQFISTGFMLLHLPRKQSPSACHSMPAYMQHTENKATLSHDNTIMTLTLTYISNHQAMLKLPLITSKS